MSIEFDVLCDQLEKGSKHRLIARLDKFIWTDWADTRMGSPCRIWTGGADRNGYARINFRYKGQHVKILVHRLFLTLMMKRPIADGMEAAHTCTEQLCVAHLQEQTRRDNMDELHGRQKRNEKGLYQSTGRRTRPS